VGSSLLHCFSLPPLVARCMCRLGRSSGFVYSEIPSMVPTMPEKGQPPSWEICVSRLKEAIGRRLNSSDRGHCLDGIVQHLLFQRVRVLGTAIMACKSNFLERTCTLGHQMWSPDHMGGMLDARRCSRAMCPVPFHVIAKPTNSQTDWERSAILLQILLLPLEGQAVSTKQVAHGG
jgi:hypothetical protein